MAKCKRGDRITQSPLILVATCVFSVMAANAKTIEVVKSGQTDLLSTVHVEVNEENGHFDGFRDHVLKSFTDGDALVLSSPQRNPLDAFLLRINFGAQFKLRARMAIDQAHHSAAGIFFFGRRNEQEQRARFMFDSNGMLGVQGELFDQCLQELRDTTAPQAAADGQWFDLEIEVLPSDLNGSSRFLLRINGEELVNTVAPSGLVQKIGFAPARAVLRIQDLSVEGDVTPSLPEDRLELPTEPKTSQPVLPTIQPATKENVIVYKEPGRYGGWPANQGLWQWGDELVVGFVAAYFKETTTDHRIDRTKPSMFVQARSLDGGKTWKREEDLPFSTHKNEAKPMPLTEPLDFTAPDFALLFRMGSLHAGPSWFYTTNDRCKTWQGPYSFEVEGVEGISTRTDLIVLGPRDCLMFGSCAKKNDGKEGRVFCARTTDGGLTWKLVSYIGEEPPPGGYAIMPSTVRTKSGVLLTAIRMGKPEVNVQLWRSDDLGKTWSRQPDVTRVGGHPAASVLLPDGRLAVTYGQRRKPWGIRARISADEGKTWTPEILLRDDGFDGDLGYPLAVVRPDGRVLTVYYFSGPKADDRAIEGTLWTPPAN